MQINTSYYRVLHKLLENEQPNSEKLAATSMKTGENMELSALAKALSQALEREGDDLERVEKVRHIADALAAGQYSVDTERLASAMLAAGKEEA